MVLWFAAIGFSGVASIFYTPEVLKAINPYYAIRFLLDNGIIGFFCTIRSHPVRYRR